MKEVNVKDNLMKRIKKEQKGSVTLFVLVSCILYVFPSGSHINQREYNHQKQQSRKTNCSNY